MARTSVSRLTLAVVLVLLGSTSAHAATPSPPSPSASSAASPSASLAAAQAAAAARARLLLDAQADSTAATTAADAALERYAAAQRVAEDAARAAQEQRWALAAASASTAQARARLQVWAAELYRSGTSDARLALLTDLLDADDASALLSGLDQVQRVTGSQGDTVDALRRAQVLQQVASRAGEVASARAATTAAQARAQRELADAVVAESARRLAAAEQGLAAAQQAVRDALARQQQAAAAAALAPAAAAARAASCTGADVGGYPNGRLPLRALCSLLDAPGQLLRADAAAAFAGLTTAYRQQFGVPLCVTDSYRDYAAQVAVRAAKPALAAVPGTSNHGWGVALDLCGGVQDPTSPQHAWMRTHALAFGWFHPAWAQADGSKPEAWHWEFAG